ncbi:Imm64 family immunity protein [Aneurinibacillus aneurinilyticus]|uniref:Uncharacterized protein n=1 Tax=Aneurinibacillus aneurinilyticus TaxID=1391 RepID=A0A848D423_ANEAE|nr:Imm64 family immunity protein [Aneurinibacillus aneurinilyticus]NMF01550.1 hypothetical protein [Aneurinibacillus aneurinilyticus]
MGGYISIALVYEDRNKLSNELKKLTRYFIQKGAILLKVKYSEDKEGENWREEIVNNNEVDFTMLTEKYYGNIDIIADMFNESLKNLKLSIHKEEGFYGFLIDIKWEELFEEHSKSSVEKITQNIINIILQLYKETQFSYAFCGHEVEIEFSPNDFNSIENGYPISVLPFNDRLEVFYGEFSIDGISFQNKSKQTYFID